MPKLVVHGYYTHIEIDGGGVGYVNVVLVYIYGCRDYGQRDQDRYTHVMYLHGLSVRCP